MEGPAAREVVASDQIPEPGFRQAERGTVQGVRAPEEAVAEAPGEASAPGTSPAGREPARGAETPGQAPVEVAGEVVETEAGAEVRDTGRTS